MTTQARWAEALLRGFYESGVRDVVLSPGSRSTPLVLAAHSVEGLRLHHGIDERSAAFFALGQARATGRPSVLVCTSGTAAAHYFPAIIEAAEDSVPIIVLTADRPTDLQGCSAPQTIDQLKLFGAYPKRFVELGEAHGSARGLRAIQRQAATAVATAQRQPAGCVHLNFRARKPLEPSTESAPEVAMRAPRVSESRRFVSPEDIRSLGGRLSSSQRLLIVAGPAGPSCTDYGDEVYALAERFGAALYVDATSQLRFGGGASTALRLEHMDLVLESAWSKESFAPDLILQVGRPPTSSAWLRWHAGRPEIPHIVLSAQGFPDVQSSADWFIQADIRQVMSAVLEEVATPGHQDGDWLEALSRVSTTACDVVTSHLNLEDEVGLGELEAAALLVNALPDSANLVVGNSLTIRHVDLLTVGSEKKLAVYSQRGANGIDGLVSGAAGVASCSDGPTVLLLGDVSMLHDIGGLALASEVDGPLVIVILNNGGGRIFERLPVASRADLGDAMPSFTTPHHYDFSGAAKLYQLPFHRVSTPGELRGALASALEGGTHLVEAVVGVQSASESLNTLTGALAAALQGD